MHCGDAGPHQIFFHIKNNSPTFGGYYDEIQETLREMSGMDELLQGNQLSESALLSVGIANSYMQLRV